MGIGNTSPTTKLDVTGDANISGTLTINGGTPIFTVVSGTAILDFPSTLAQTSSDLKMFVLGADLGDVVWLGVPNASTLSNSAYTAWVSVTDTVKVRFNNYSSGALNPSAGTFRAAVIQF